MASDQEIEAIGQAINQSASIDEPEYTPPTLDAYIDPTQIQIEEHPDQKLKQVQKEVQEVNPNEPDEGEGDPAPTPTQTPEQIAAAAKKQEGTEEVAAGQELGDESEISIGQNEDGTPITVKMGELLEGYAKSQTVDEDVSTLGLKAPEMTDVIRGYSLEKVQGFDMYTNELAAYESESPKLKSEIDQLMASKASLIASVDPNADDFDSEKASRVAFKITQLDTEIQAKSGQLNGLKQRFQTAGERQVENTKRAVDAAIGSFWPEYQNPATRQSAVDGLANQVHSIYGEDVNATINAMTSSPRAAAMLRDAIAYRELVSGASKVIGKEIAKGDVDAGNKSNIFAYRGKVQVKGNADATKTATSHVGKKAGSVDAPPQATAKQIAMLARGDTDGFVRSVGLA